MDQGAPQERDERIAETADVRKLETGEEVKSLIDDVVPRETRKMTIGA